MLSIYYIIYIKWTQIFERLHFSSRDQTGYFVTKKNPPSLVIPSSIFIQRKLSTEFRRVFELIFGNNFNLRFWVSQIIITLWFELILTYVLRVQNRTKLYISVNIVGEMFQLYVYPVNPCTIKLENWLERNGPSNCNTPSRSAWTETMPADLSKNEIMHCIFIWTRYRPMCAQKF